MSIEFVLQTEQVLKIGCATVQIHLPLYTKIIRMANFVMYSILQLEIFLK